MPRHTVANAISFSKALDRSIHTMEKKWIKRNQKLVTQSMRRLIAKTPVHTGRTVRSYMASNGTAKHTNKSEGNPVEATNKLPLGAEQLRGRAAAEALATLSSVNFSDPYDVFFITNNSPAVAGLEVGALPAEPYTPRSPQGMFGVTLQEITALADLGIL